MAAPGHSAANGAFPTLCGHWNIRIPASRKLVSKHWKSSFWETSSRLLVAERPAWAQQLMGMTLPNVRFLNGIDCGGYRSPPTVIGGS